nr:autotransporter outer membrane beta-barrel domain-containing protein [Negativicutes bacterium]
VSTYVMLNDNSSWIGNLDGHISRSGNFGAGVTGTSVWHGDLSISSSGKEDSPGVYGSASVGDHSAWVGDANIVNGAFSSNIYDGSSWKGSLMVDNSKYEGQFSGHISVSMQDHSSWEGDMTVIGSEKEDSYPSNHFMNLYRNVIWKGDFNITNSLNTIYASQNSINLSGHSVWLGDAVLNGNNYMNLYISDNSDWIGNLDLSQNNIDIENQMHEGYVYIGDHSNWQGHIVDSKYGVGLQVYDDSNWRMTGDSLVDMLYFDQNSTISFVPEANQRSNSFSTLTVLQNLDGGNGSQFNLRTDIAANQGDLLDVRGHVDGQYLVGINNQGSAWVNPANELTIVKTGSSDEDAFSLVNAVEVGGFEYGLKQVGTDWNLYSTGRASSSASASLNGFAGSYLLNYAETQTLTQRLGDLRQGENQNGVWAKVYGGKFNSSADSFLSGFDMTYSGIQVGGDHQIALKEGNGDLYVGGMFGYGKGNLDYGVGSGSVDSKTLGVYGTYKAPTGFYADMVLKYGWMKNDYKVLDSSNVTIKGDDMNTSGLSASMEIGQRLHLDRKTKEGWYVEPQAQLTVGHQSGGSFTASNGLNINVDSYNSVLGRVGMQAGYEVKSGKNPINVYAKASYVHEFDGDVGIRFNGVGVNQSFGDSWITYGVGATAQIGKKHNLYVDIERASGGKFNQPWAVNAGYRFEW